MAQPVRKTVLTWKGRRVYDSLTDRVVLAMRRAAETAVQVGRTKAHVVTGEMRDNIYADVGLDENGKMQLSVGSPVPQTVAEVYRGGEHDWLRPTMDATIKDFRDELSRAARRGT